MMTSLALRAVLCAVLIGAVACSPSPSSQPAPAATTPPASSAAPAPSAQPPAGGGEPKPAATATSGDDEQPLAATPSPYDALPQESRELLDQPFKGDFDEMVKRRLIRAGVVFNRTQYFIDKGVQRGISYESINLFEEEMNKRLKTGLLKVHVAIVPLARDQLFPSLQEGKVDFVAAALTITPERTQARRLQYADADQRVGDRRHRARRDAGRNVDDLSGREVFVRRSSSYYESLLRLNESLASRGKAPVVIKEAPEALEDDDLLEMVNAGLVELTVVDDFVVEFWQQVFPNVTPITDAAVRTGGEIAVGVRKNNPKMLQAVNTWIKKYGPRTAFGNMMERGIWRTPTTSRTRPPRRTQEAAGDGEVLPDIRRPVQRGLPADGRAGVSGIAAGPVGEEPVGAIGVMQVMPATGKELAVGDIHQVDPNIHAGVKYFRFMMDQYYKDEPMDELNKGLMTLASYNAGPARVRQLRKEAAQRGLNPNVWFGNVERVASERIGRETVTYVSNIYKYYVAYRLMMDRRIANAQAKEAVTKDRH